MLNWVRSDVIKWSRDSIRHTGTSVGPGAFPRVQLPADPLDARVIASFVTIMPTRPAQRQTPAAERLAEMLAIRRQLSAEKVAAENASRLLEDAMLQRLSCRRIVRLAADIDLLDKRRGAPRHPATAQCIKRAVHMKIGQGDALRGVAARIRLKRAQQLRTSRMHALMLQLNRRFGALSGCRSFNALQIRSQGRALHVFFLWAFGVDVRR